MTFFYFEKRETEQKFFFLYSINIENLPLLLCPGVDAQHQPVVCLAKTKPDVWATNAQINLNHTVDLLNLQRFRLMFRLPLKCHHLNLTPTKHVTGIITITPTKANMKKKKYIKEKKTKCIRMWKENFIISMGKIRLSDFFVRRWRQAYCWTMKWIQRKVKNWFRLNVIHSTQNK